MLPTRALVCALARGTHRAHRLGRCSNNAALVPTPAPGPFAGSDSAALAGVLVERCAQPGLSLGPCVHATMWPSGAAFSSHLIYCRDLPVPFFRTTLTK